MAPFRRVRLAFRLSPALVVALLALMLSVTGNAAAALIITSNSQVAQNTIAGHHPPSGKHANIIAGSISGVDLSAPYRNSVRVVCPNGMQQQRALCFDRTTSTAASWFSAFQACASRYLRLPSPDELALVYQNTDAGQGYQWTDALDYDGSRYAAVVVSQNTSRVLDVAEIAASSNNVYRCVVNAAQ